MVYIMLRDIKWVILHKTTRTEHGQWCSCTMHVYLHVYVSFKSNPGARFIFKLKKWIHLVGYLELLVDLIVCITYNCSAWSFSIVKLRSLCVGVSINKSWLPRVVLCRAVPPPNLKRRTFEIWNATQSISMSPFTLHTYRIEIFPHVVYRNWTHSLNEDISLTLYKL